MFGKKIPLFKLFGFQINIDWSWFIVFILVAWSLAASAFPAQYGDLSQTTYWIMGVIGALALFASIVLHELGHSLVARRYDVHMTGITLFIFGGVAEMRQEPKKPVAEFFIAIAGPVVSVLIAAACGGLFLLGSNQSWSPAIQGVLGYLAMINAVVVIFNSIPAFPLDGGRVLRALLWKWKDNLKWATRVTSQIGSGFGLLLILLGVFAFLSGNFVGGMWWFLIGMFLRGAASMSYQQLLMRRALEGEPVSEFMNADPITVPEDATLDDFVENYVYRHHHKLFPVVSNGHLRGCITTEDVKNVSRSDWEITSVADVMHGCSDENTISKDTDAMDALSRMNQSDRSKLLVTDGERLAGVLSLKDLLQFFSLKVELEDEGRA